MEKHPKMIIVGTVPYNPQSTSRAFESYFANWEKENLAQVFSHPKKPAKGHCGYFYQITDYRLLKKRLNRKIKTGIAYEDEDLLDAWKDNSIDVEGSVAKKMYAKKNRKTPFWHLVRKFIWSKKNWNTPDFNRWLDNFKPEVVFLSFSDDFFILEIALYIAKKFNIPIISSTGDDYYFNTHFSLSPFYHIYKRKYKRLVRKVLAYPGDIIYIGDKIKNKYNEHFNLSGQTIYLCSHAERRPYRKIDLEKMNVAYFGNIACGRNDAIINVGKALNSINENYFVNVYSNERSTKILKKFNNKKGVRFNGSIPYKDVIARMNECDAVLVVEGFKKKDILNTKYSLSTKVADSLASGVFIIAHGSEECGAIQYLNDTNAALVVTKKEDLIQAIKEALNNEEYFKNCYNQAIEITINNHRLENSLTRFEAIVKNAMEKWKENNQRK